MAESLAILWPHDGDVLNRHDGQLTDEALVIQVTGITPPDAEVTVNGIPAVVEGKSFTCSVPLTQCEEIIEARATHGVATIRVLCDRNSVPRYRFSVDDNIHWLADLGREPDSFSSLFDHWYMAFWRRMHREYAAKIHLNIYYQTLDHSFNLSMMPEKWRDEFEESSDWLRLSFHALQHMPNRLYRQATYDQIAHDLELVMNEIKRFAGPALTTRTTTIHWADMPREACRALVDGGVDRLISLFYYIWDAPTWYYLDEQMANYIHTRDAWWDTTESIIFVDCDAVINGLTLDQIVPHLELRAANPHTGEMLELANHEQYFRKDLPGFYQPDIFEKSERAINWVTEHGYEPCFWGDGFLGSPK
jgi:hypothetical protein